MEGITFSVSAGGAASAAAGAIKDTTGAQLITKTLDLLDTGMSLSGPVANAEHQFRKDVLAAAGIGGTLEISV